MIDIVLDGVSVKLNKKQVISIGTSDNITYRVVCASGFQFDTTDQSIIDAIKA